MRKKIVKKISILLFMILIALGILTSLCFGLKKRSKYISQIEVIASGKIETLECKASGKYISIEDSNQIRVFQSLMKEVRLGKSKSVRNIKPGSMMYTVIIGYEDGEKIIATFPSLRFNDEGERCYELKNVDAIESYLRDLLFKEES